MERKHYESLDGLRAAACFGIVMMHMRANNPYEISGFIYNRIIPSFTDFVFLFMAVSAFGMCCGYYGKILSGNIDFPDFYKKRYAKTLPFFSVLVFLDLIVGFSKESLYEAIADLSLTFGLFPNNITVIGVGWFLGLVFVFYLIFPFFCVLLENKKRAWLALGAALILNYIGGEYFGLGRANIVYSSCFFITGGLVFLYKDQLDQLKWYITAPIVILAVAMYYVFGRTTVTQLCVSVSLLVFALGNQNRVLQNRFTAFISGISMEIYLSHMVVFRIVEKFHFNLILGKGMLQYAATVLVVFGGTVLFSIIVKYILKLAENKVVKRYKK